MDPKQLQFAVLSPRATLSVAAATLLTMPVAYFVYTQWPPIGKWLLFLGIWGFVISQVVVIWQGAVVFVSCGFQGRRGKFRLFGIWLILYGVALLAMAFGFALLATFGGPRKDEQLFFFAIMWMIAFLLSIPAGIYLRRRSASICKATDAIMSRSS
jgi:hypothetical protein